MTKYEKTSAFAEDLKRIPFEPIRDWTSKCIELIPDYFFKVGVSSTGKHHPYWSKGEGGTFRHTRAVFDMAILMSGTFSQADTMVISRAGAAALLHDSFKYGITYDVRLYDLHPYLPRAMFKRVPYTFEDKDREIIFRAIESHMGSVTDGSWSLLPYITKENLSRESVAHIVHVADYIVSRENYIDHRFIDCTSGPKPYDLYDDNTLIGFFYARLLNKVTPDVASKLVQDQNLTTSIIGRCRALKTSGDKVCNLYNYDDIIKNIDSNLEWILKSADLER